MYGGRMRRGALPSRADIVVVGAGTAGCAVAARMAGATDGTVLVLEAGPDYGPFEAERWPGDLLDASCLAQSHDWGYFACAADGRVLPIERARVIGGCSAHNGCTQSWGWRGDYDAWAAAGCPGWSGRDMEPALRCASDRLRVRHYAEPEIQPLQAGFLAAAEEVGIPRTDDLDNLDGGEGSASNPVNVVDGVRWNSAFAYLDPVRDDPRLAIHGHAMVDRLVLDGSRVRGLIAIADGRRQRIDADLVVLSAGVYGSPEILLRSGIGDPLELERVGVGCAHELTGVGQGVHDQVAAHLEYAATPTLAEQLRQFARQGWLPEEQAVAKLATGRSPHAPFDVHVYPWVEEDLTVPSGWRCVFPVAVLRPRSHGRVSLRSPNPLVRADIDHAYLNDPRDLEILAAGLTRVDELCAAEPLDALLGERLVGPPDANDPDAVHHWIRANHQHYWHPVGGCRMGPDHDALAVVDHRAAVHGLTGLHIADGSIFPNAPRATPALPTVAVGERVAALLVCATPAASD
jgi:choline dehydrogenase